MNIGLKMGSPCCQRRNRKHNVGSVAPVVLYRGFRRRFCISNIFIAIRPMPMKRQSSDKKFGLQRYAPEFSGTACDEHEFQDGNFPSFPENPEKNNCGVDVRPRSASETLRRMFSSKRRDSESSIDIDRQN